LRQRAFRSAALTPVKTSFAIDFQGGNPVRSRSSAANSSPPASENRTADSAWTDVPPTAPSAPQPVPRVRGSRSSYYLFQQGGQRMAVTLVDRGARLRINDSIDIVVLEIYDGSVKIGLVERMGENDEG
jgi:hypothetical protein